MTFPPHPSLSPPAPDCGGRGAVPPRRANSASVCALPFSAYPYFSPFCGASSAVPACPRAPLPPRPLPPRLPGPAPPAPSPRCVLSPPHSRGRARSEGSLQGWAGSGWVWGVCGVWWWGCPRARAAARSFSLPPPPSPPLPPGRARARARPRLCSQPPPPFFFHFPARTPLPSTHARTPTSPWRAGLPSWARGEEPFSSPPSRIWRRSCLFFFAGVLSVGRVVLCSGRGARARSWGVSVR